MDDACPNCGNSPCSCGGDLMPEAPGTAEAAEPAATEGGEEGGDLGL